MNRYFKALVFTLTLVAVLALTFSHSAPVEACIPFYCCIDNCDAEWEACSAACPPNSPMCEFACNNAWWECNDECAGL